MKYKLLFTEILIGAMLGYACGVVFADTPMAKLRLSTDMNGGGHSITNLDTISVSNAPWATPSEVTNIVTAIGGGGGIGEESDPVAYPVATNALAIATATNNPNHVTAAQVGALPAKYKSGFLAIDASGISTSTQEGFIFSRIGWDSVLFGSAVDYSVYNITFGQIIRESVLSSKWLWPDTASESPLVKRDELAATNTLISSTLSLKANAETIYTGAVCPASEGTRYYWASGTNVTLSVGTLTAGKPVNIAKLNNTATNSITAIGKAGWVWTGGEMTNTITAGKSMTFGFLVDPSNGKTNAYATGVSK